MNGQRSLDDDTKKAGPNAKSLIHIGATIAVAIVHASVAISIIFQGLYALVSLIHMLGIPTVGK